MWVHFRSDPLAPGPPGDPWLVGLTRCVSPGCVATRPTLAGLRLPVVPLRAGRPSYGPWRAVASCKAADPPPRRRCRHHCLVARAKRNCDVPLLSSVSPKFVCCRTFFLQQLLNVFVCRALKHGLLLPRPIGQRPNRVWPGWDQRPWPCPVWSGLSCLFNILIETRAAMPRPAAL